MWPGVLTMLSMTALTACNVGKTTTVVVDPAPELERLVSTSRAIPDYLLQCQPFDPHPDDAEGRAGWLGNAWSLHQSCVERAAAARALQRGE